MLRFALRVTLVWVGLAVATIPSATAALFLEFEPPSAPPGAKVQANTVGRGALPPLTMVPAFLAPVEALETLPEDVHTVARLRRHPRLTSIGTLSSDQNGDGSLSFTVPRVPPGRYAAILFCRSCESFSGGRTVIVAGRISVTSLAALAQTGVSLAVIAGMAMSLLLAGIGLLACSATRRWP